jgi:hypothetical protein
MPLAFPSGKLPDNREVQFRDGTCVVPEYLADLMSGMDTVRFTYDECIDKVNEKLLADRLNAAMDGVINNHFRGGGV